MSDMAKGVETGLNPGMCYTRIIEVTLLEPEGGILVYLICLLRVVSCGTILTVDGERWRNESLFF